MQPIPGNLGQITGNVGRFPPPPPLRPRLALATWKTRFLAVKHSHRPVTRLANMFVGSACPPALVPSERGAGACSPHRPQFCRSRYWSTLYRICSKPSRRLANRVLSLWTKFGRPNFLETFLSLSIWPETRKPAEIRPTPPVFDRHHAKLDASHPECGRTDFRNTPGRAGSERLRWVV